MIAYHGSGVEIKEFNLNYLEGGEHSFGIGIYFTTNKKFTEYYVQEGGFVHKCEFDDSSFISFDAQLESKHFEALGIEYISGDFEKIIHEIRRQFELDNKGFVELFVSKTGIKGCVKTALYNDVFRTDFCVFSPDIKILSIESHP